MFSEPLKPRNEVPPIELGKKYAGLEETSFYVQDSLHPVQLGDELNCRYKVLNKLGHGEFATVWLCQDISSSAKLHDQYVAVKINLAIASSKYCPELQFFESRFYAPGGAPLWCLPLDHFWHPGVNGKHLAFAYPVHGPSAADMYHILHNGASDRNKAALKTICYQATQAMAQLHYFEICHGDFTPNNILVRIPNLHGLTEVQVKSYLGVPGLARVREFKEFDYGRLDGEHVSRVPTHFVYSINWKRLFTYTSWGQSIWNYYSFQACVIDFGDCYPFGSRAGTFSLNGIFSKGDFTGTIPMRYRAPEEILEGRRGPEVDIWALGCTLFEIRCGRPLFDHYVEEPEYHLCWVAKVLGRFPIVGGMAAGKSAANGFTMLMKMGGIKFMDGFDVTRTTTPWTHLGRLG